MGTGKGSECVEATSFKGHLQYGRGGVQSGLDPVGRYLLLNLIS